MKRFLLTLMLALWAVPALAQVPGGGGTVATVTDGTNTVKFPSVLDFTSGATVSKSGDAANVAIPGIGNCAASGCIASTNGTGTGTTLTNPTLSGTVTGTPTWASGQTMPTLTLTGTGTSTLGSGITFDYSGGATDTRYFYIDTFLTPSVSTSHIWEQDNSFLTLEPVSGDGNALLTATESGGTATVVISAAGSSYPNGTYTTYTVGGACTVSAQGTATISGGAVTSVTQPTTSGCTGNPTVNIEIAVASGEINVTHDRFGNTAGAYATQVEDHEDSSENNGAIINHQMNLSTFQNDSNGSVNSLAYYAIALTNNNTNPGAINQMLGVDCINPSGTKPKSMSCLYDSITSGIDYIAGGLVIGRTYAGNPQTLQIYGPDNSAGTYALYIANLAGTPILTVDDGGGVNAVDGTLRVGTNASVGGTMYIYGSSSGNAQISGGTSGTLTSPSPVNFSNATIQLSGISSDAGKSDATVCTVTVGGGALYSGSGTGGLCLSTSTARYKDHIEDAFEGFSGGLHILRELFALRTVHFTYKKGHGFDPTHVYWGWTAEQMQTVFPDLVGHDAEGKPNSVDMMGMLPRVVAAVQAGEYLVLGMLAAMIVLALYCVGLHAHAVSLRRRVAAIEAVMRAAQ